MRVLEDIRAILRGAGAAGSCVKTIEEVGRKHGLIVSFDVGSADSAAIGTIQRLHCRSASNGTPTSPHFLNGVIIDGSGAILAYPPKSLSHCHADVLRENEAIKIEDYEVIEAVNGTVATLYWDGAEWRIGSSRSTDITHLSLMGDLEFRKALEQIMAAKGLDWSVFDTGHSYTFVLCHPTYHILPIFDLFFVVCWSVATEQYVDLPEPLLPLRQIRRDYDKETIVDRCYRSVENLKGGDREGVFGYVLRAKNMAAGAADYYVENDVMSYLRTAVYQTYGQTHAIEYQWRKLHILIKVMIAREDDPVLFEFMFEKRFDAELGELRGLFKTLEGLYEVYVRGGCGRLAVPMPEEFYKLVSLAAASKLEVKDLICQKLAGPLFEYARVYS